VGFGILVVHKCHLCAKDIYIFFSVLTGTCCSAPFTFPARRTSPNQLPDVVGIYYEIFSLFAHLEEHWQSSFTPSLYNRSN